MIYWVLAKYLARAMTSWKDFYGRSFVGRFLFCMKKGDNVLGITTKEEVLEKAKECNVKFIRLQFTGTCGAFKKYLPPTMRLLPASMKSL
jgi:hypothetical protein